MNEAGARYFTARMAAADGQVRVELAGEIDLHVRDDLKAALEAAIRAGADVVVDLTDVTFLDASGVGALVGARRKLEGQHDLRIHGARAGVRRVLDITGVAALLGEETDAPGALGRRESFA